MERDMSEPNVVNLNEFGSGRRRSRAEALVLLNECRNRLVEGVSRLLTRQAEAMENVLLSMAERSPLLETRNLYYAAQSTLNHRANETFIACKQAYLQAFDGAVLASENARAAKGESELSLLDDTDFEAALAVNKAATRLRYNSAEELVALDVRVGNLLNRPQLAEEENPLGTKALCQSWLDGLGNLGLDIKVRLILLNQFDLALNQELAGIYQDINHYLADKGVLTDIRASQPTRKGAGGSERTSGNEADEFVKLFEHAAASGGMPLAGALPVAGTRGTAGAVGWGYPAAGGGDGLGVGMVEALGRLQAGGLALPGGGSFELSLPANGFGNVLRELQQSPVMQAASQLDAVIIDAVAMLFDFIFDDDSIPDGLKSLVARLQVPVLKVALIDRGFFGKKQHPARQLLDKISDLASDLPPVVEGKHPLIIEIETVINRVLRDFDSDFAVFEDACAQLDLLAGQREARVEAEIAPQIRELEREERSEIAPQVAHDQISRALVDQQVPFALSQFLYGYWAVALTQSYTGHGEASPIFISRMETMRELIWSVQSKTDMDARLMLVRILPGLLKRLREGLADTDMPHAEMERFFADLVIFHANAVRSMNHPLPLPETEAQAATAAPPPPPAVVEAEPEDEVEDQYTQMARDLNKGDWVEFHYDDGTFRWARLGWTGSMKGIYLFTDQDGLNTFSINVHRLAEKLRNGNAQIVQRKPITESAFGKLLGFFRQKTSPA